jgi:hypothetical protein
MPTRKSNFIINSFICIMCSGHTYYYSIKYLNRTTNLKEQHNDIVNL